MSSAEIDYLCWNIVLSDRKFIARKAGCSPSTVRAFLAKERKVHPVIAREIRRVMRENKIQRTH